MMKTTWIIILAAVFVCAILAQAEADPLNCQDNGKQCSTNEDCCSGCCQHGKCTRRDACLSKQEGPCSFHQCPSGKECFLQRVECVTAPCNPVPACRNKDSDYE